MCRISEIGSNFELLKYPSTGDEQRLFFFQCEQSLWIITTLHPEAISDS
jgi:hypothetical protein